MFVEVVFKFNTNINIKVRMQGNLLWIKSNPLLKSFVLPRQNS